MQHYPEYAPRTAAELDEVARGQRVGRLVTVTPAGSPRIGLYPYLYDGATVEVHLVRGDEQVRDLGHNPACLFEVDDVLSYIPSHFEDPEDATRADVFYRAVVLEGRATVVDDPEALVDHLRRLLARYQPERRYRELSADDPLYRASVARLVLVRVAVERPRAKFKLGQKQPEPERRRVLDALRARDEPGDARTAEVVERTLSDPE